MWSRATASNRTPGFRHARADWSPGLPASAEYPEVADVYNSDDNARRCANAARDLIPARMPNRELIIAEIPRLRRYARALTGDSSRADDLVQDTLERALSRFSLWRPGNLRAWLFTIMHNIFVNQIRSAAHIDYLADDLLPDLPLRATQSDNLELRDLDRALGRLTAEQREVLLLVGLEDLSYEEAAKVVGAPVGTVMSRLSRGRERLRALLAGVEIPAGAQLRVVK